MEETMAKRAAKEKANSASAKAEAKKKTGPKMVKWSVTASGRKRKTTKPRKRIA